MLLFMKAVALVAREPVTCDPQPWCVMARFAIFGLGPSGAVCNSCDGGRFDGSWEDISACWKRFEGAQGSKSAMYSL